MVVDLRITHPFATSLCGVLQKPVRLACVKHAASVRSEPGSNSPKKFFLDMFENRLYIFEINLIKTIKNVKCKIKNCCDFIIYQNIFNF